MAAQTCKFTIVGDPAVGKMCFVETLTKGEFPTEYIPCIMDNFSISVLVDGEEVCSELMITSKCRLRCAVH